MSERYEGHGGAARGGPDTAASRAALPSASGARSRTVSLSASSGTASSARPAGLPDAVSRTALRSARPVPGTAAAVLTLGPDPDDAQIPFLGHTFRVSGLRDELHARRAAPDGWIRHA